MWVVPMRTKTDLPKASVLECFRRMEKGDGVIFMSCLRRCLVLLYLKGGI